MQDSKRSTTEHFDVLDGLRGVAAGLVLVGHASAVMLGPEQTFVPRKILAVLFFFMLSGFVVASSYERRLVAGMTVGQFMLRRGIRLYPLIVLGALLGTAWFAAFDPAFRLSRRSLLAPLFGALAIPSPYMPFSFGRFPINPPEWSLFFEMICYGLFAVALTQMKTWRLAALSGAALIAYGAVDVVYYGFEMPLMFVMFEAAGSFSAGMMIWRACEVGRLPNIRAPSWMLAVSIAIVCLIPRSFGPAIDIIAAVAVFPTVLALGAMRGRGVATKGERLLGAMSYPLYILHWPCLLAVNAFVRPQLGARAAMSFAVLTALAVSWLALRVVDEPIRAWLAKRLLTRARIGTEFAGR